MQTQSSKPFRTINLSFPKRSALSDTNKAALFTILILKGKSSKFYVKLFRVAINTLRLGNKSLLKYRDQSQRHTNDDIYNADNE